MRGEDWDETRSAVDDDTRDMEEGDLFSREWDIVGTIPPNEQSSSNLEHLAFYFQEKDESGDEDGCSTPVQAMVYRPITYNPAHPYQLELLPILEKSLGRYYYHYKTSVSLDSDRDMLINLCKRGLKSPCFDVRDCYLADVTSIAHKGIPNAVNVGDRVCVPVISNDVIESVIEEFAQLDLSITLVKHDVYKYSTSRLRLSPLITQSDIPDEDWTDDIHRDVRRITNCSAVATATLTISMILRTVYGSSSKYLSKKNLDIVIHAIK